MAADTIVSAKYNLVSVPENVLDHPEPDTRVRKSKLVTLDDVLFLGANTVKEFSVETALYLCMSGGLARNMARLRWRYPRTYRFSNVSSALLYTVLITTVCRNNE